MKIISCAQIIAFLLLLITNNNLIKSSEATRVTVINGIQNDNINIHCYSSEDDLGNHVLSYGTNFTWHFRVNFMGTTKFNCDFNTTKYGSGNYGVYTPNLRRMHCNVYCEWLIKEKGPCVKQNVYSSKLWCQDWQNMPSHSLQGFSPSPSVLPLFDDDGERKQMTS